MLPLIILLSSLIGSVWNLFLMKNKVRADLLRFVDVPYIAIAGIVALLFEHR
jgi:prepilin signal peptidase PulO-like enzyme (type II secretory pathway)